MQNKFIGTTDLVLKKKYVIAAHQITLSLILGHIFLSPHGKYSEWVDIGHDPILRVVKADWVKLDLVNGEEVITFGTDK